MLEAAALQKRMGEENEKMVAAKDERIRHLEERLKAKSAEADNLRTRMTTAEAAYAESEQRQNALKERLNATLQRVAQAESTLDRHFGAQADAMGNVVSRLDAFAESKAKVRPPLARASQGQPERPTHGPPTAADLSDHGSTATARGYGGHRHSTTRRPP